MEYYMWRRTPRRFVPAFKRKEMEDALNWDYTGMRIYRKLPFAMGFRLRTIISYPEEIKWVNERRPKK
jgi:hypothetical protein